MLFHCRSFPRNLLGFPKNLPVPIYTPGWREARWELSVLPKNTTQCPRPGLEPRPLNPESSALTMRSPHLPHYLYYWGIISNVLSPILASNSWSDDSTTVGVVKNRTNMNNSVLISTVLAHQLSWSTDKCSQMISPATGALVTFQWSEKIFLDTDDSGLPCLTVLKSLRHLQKQYHSTCIFLFNLNKNLQTT